MSPERRRWLAFVTASKGYLEAVAGAALQRMCAHDVIALTGDEKRDVASLIAICEQAAVLCDRLSSSLGHDA